MNRRQPSVPDKHIDLERIWSIPTYHLRSYKDLISLLVDMTAWILNSVIVTQRKRARPLKQSLVEYGSVVILKVAQYFSYILLLITVLCPRWFKRCLSSSRLVSDMFERTLSLSVNKERLVHVHLLTIGSILINYGIQVIFFSTDKLL